MWCDNALEEFELKTMHFACPFDHTPGRKSEGKSRTSDVLILLMYNVNHLARQLI